MKNIKGYITYEIEFIWSNYNRDIEKYGFDDNPLTKHWIYFRLIKYFV